MTRTNSSIRSKLFVIVIVFNLLILGAIAYIYLRPAVSAPIKPAESLDEIKENETANWLTFPTEGSYIGWTIKHPAANTPKANQQNTQVSIKNGQTEAALIVMKLANKPSDTSLKEHLSTLIELDHCVSKSPVSNYFLSDYQVYRFSSFCGENTVGDSILFKNKTTYAIQNPYDTGSFFSAQVYSDPAIVNQANLDLAEKIFNTVKILQPEISQETEEIKVENVETTNTVPTGYVEHKNTSVGYSIQYPEKYRKENSSGWKNGDLILYSGGQVYDLIIQVWQTEAEYKAYFADNPAAVDSMTIFEVNGQYVTLVNSGNDSEVKTIINSFRKL